MTTLMLAWVITASQIILGIAMLCATWRVVTGPRAQDRVLGLDNLYLNAMMLMITFGIQSGNTIYFEMPLLIGMLGFVSTVALSKFLMRGEVIE